MWTGICEIANIRLNDYGALKICRSQVYTIIEALADGSVKQGVPRQMAIQFAAQTVLGAAKTVIQTGKHPAVLRDEVKMLNSVLQIFSFYKIIKRTWHRRHVAISCLQ